jgi:hypothetical protein
MSRSAVLRFLCFTVLTISLAARAETQDRFRYDSASGKCLNAKGEEGYNPIDKASFVANKDGECGEFGEDLIFSPTDNPLGFTQPFNGWNFKGANMNTFLASGGPFCGVNFTNADLRGAKMDALNGVYWCIEGTIDRYTTYTLVAHPDIVFGCRLVKKDRLKCVE